jgi:hypothetical protein
MSDSYTVTVETVQCEAYVLAQPQKHGHWAFVRKQNTRYCKAYDNSNELNNGNSDTIDGQELKEPYRKEFIVLAYGVLGILG